MRRNLKGLVEGKRKDQNPLQIKGMVDLIFLKENLQYFPNRRIKWDRVKIPPKEEEDILE